MAMVHTRYGKVAGTTKDGVMEQTFLRSANLADSQN